MIYLDAPPAAWADPTDCGEWPCTAPRNVVLEFTGTQFTGIDRPIRTSPDFTIVYDMPTATQSYS